jgi:hypothetical protein
MESGDDKLARWCQWHGVVSICVGDALLTCAMLLCMTCSPVHIWSSRDGDVAGRGYGPAGWSEWLEDYGVVCQIGWTEGWRFAK